MSFERSTNLCLLLTLLSVLPSHTLIPSDRSMNSLQRLGISAHLSKSDFFSALNPLSNQALLDLRYDLFVEAVNQLLVPANKILVNRKGSAVNPVSSKLAEDIWTLTDCVKHRKSLPRVILKNGKRDRITFENTLSQSSLTPPNSAHQTDDSTQSHQDPVPPLPALELTTTSVATATLMKEINIIKDELRSVKTYISTLNTTQSSDSILRDEVGNLRQSLSELWEIVHPSSNLQNIPRPHIPGNMSHPVQSSQVCHSVSIAAWNCRGLSNSIPYLQVLSDEFDVIAISEHWLWPYELSTLDCALPGYKGHGCSDKRLTENADSGRGYGGVALLWKSSLSVTPIVALKSDRMVAIQLTIDDDTCLAVIGVYLPCSDSPTDCYREYLTELESVICTLQADGPVIVVGDFNAHFEEAFSTNVQGHMVMDLCYHHDLYPVSQSHSASGPKYTYHSGSHYTTVDYCLLDCWAAHMVRGCGTIDHHSLNLSDHLPVFVHLDINHLTNSKSTKQVKLNWKKASTDGSIDEYKSQLHDCISTLLSDSPPPSTIEGIGDEIERVAEVLRHTALNTIPAFKPRKAKKKFINDQTLKMKCQASKFAWLRWRNSGRPRSGPLYTSMKSMKSEVKAYVKQCRAREERARIQRRDQLFKDKDPARFNLPRRSITCQKLAVDGKIVSDKTELLECWKAHFASLAKSQPHCCESTPSLNARSFGHDDQILDTQFTIEEIENAVTRLKCGKGGGADGLQPEHLKYGCHSLTLWLQRIFNAIILLEDIPSCLKLGVIVPVFKGKGRDPLNPNNYRGITLTSVVAKCLETALLERLSPILLERGFPHQAQSAYRRGISCADAIFSTQESILKYIRDDENPILCFFDLEKAFDSVEYDVLLEHLFRIGVNGKFWRLMKNWYSNSMSVVKLHDQFSECFPVNRGVKQGSVLSPTLFNIVIDSLLRHLDTTGQSLCISGLNVGSSGHADDIRAASNFPEAAKVQGNCVSAFCSANFLTLNTSKTEAVIFSKRPPASRTIDVAGQSINTQATAKCLGVWWQHDLSPCRSVEENIAKARRAFFALGSIGSFQGKTNPLTSKSVFETFVIPTLLYGCETWILTDALISKLEKFQSEIGRRILKLGKYHNDLAPIIGLHLPSIKARILLRKLNFLSKLLESVEDDICSRLFRTLSAENVYSISLVEQCKWLQNEISTDPVLQQCLLEPAEAKAIVRNAKEDILKQDWIKTLVSARKHQSLKYIACTDSVAASWCRLWDQAMDLGTKGTGLIQCLLSSLCRPVFGDRQCPHCGDKIPLSQNFFDHLCNEHLKCQYNQQIASTLEQGGQDVLDMATVISQFYHNSSNSSSHL